MIKELITIAIAIASFTSVFAQNIIGVWSGELKVSPQISLKLVFHINDDSSITMDSPDQGAYGISGETVYLSNDSINMKIPKLMMTYSGNRIDNKIEGTFKQGGLSLPLNLMTGEKKINRPQTPIPPFPYTIKEVSIDHDYVSLAGTLTIPENATKKTPVVVMVTGSGQQNRDEELFEHKPFAVIADYLARNGIASLRYDDRGIGGSTGKVANATTADFAQDAESVVKYMRKSNLFGKIGLIGHSEGGLIAYMLGAKPKTLDFIVSIAGPSVRGDSILICQNRNSLAKSGITGKMADDFTNALSKAFKLIIDNDDTVLTEAKLTEIYPQWNDDQTTRKLAQSIKRLLEQQMSEPWMRYFMTYSPSKDLKSLKIPAMIIYGGKDTQVPSAINAPIAQLNAQKAMIKIYPYANHLMQHATSGEVDEYKTIEETFSPEILKDIVTFIKSL